MATTVINSGQFGLWMLWGLRQATQRKLSAAASPKCNTRWAFNRSMQCAVGNRVEGDAPRRKEQQLKDDAVAQTDNRGGPTQLSHLVLQVVAQSDHLLVLNKEADHRLDGKFDATIEKALHRDFPSIPKFRWIHQLDFATSGVLCIALNKPAAAFGAKMFRTKKTQKEYLAVVHGHLPFDPCEFAQHQQKTSSGTRGRGMPFTSCALSKVPLFIQDMAQLEQALIHRKGTPTHEKDPKYPKGPRQGVGFLMMDQARLRRNAAKTPLTDSEKALVQTSWKQLDPPTKQMYLDKSAQDQKRFLAELMQFLDQERAKLIQSGRFGPKSCPTTEEASNSQSDGTKRRRTQAVDSKYEPMAYVFDDPIEEPDDAKSFRMRIGDRTALADEKRAGKPSMTLAFVLGHDEYLSKPVTKVLLRPLSGRRHQLRLHLAHHGFPIVGDATYGDPEDPAPRMMLHAWRLWLMASEEERKRFGDCFFATEDPFESIVKSERKLTTIHRTNESETM